MRFNTAISALMIFLNENETMSKEVYETFLKLLSPFAPHIAEELWASLGHKDTITLSQWPKWDESQIKNEEVKIVIQVNGKVRALITMPHNTTEADVKTLALKHPSILKYTLGKTPKKTIYVPGRLINIVV